MQAKDNRLDFISIQANDLIARINRMLKHSNTRLTVRQEEVVLTFKTETEELTRLLSIPAKIGSIPVRKVHLASPAMKPTKPLLEKTTKKTSHKNRKPKKMAFAK